MIADVVASHLTMRPDLPFMENIMCALDCAKEGNITLNDAKNLHAGLCNFGLETHASIVKHLFLMYIECESLLDAQQVFNKLPYRTLDQWSFLIQAYIQSNNPEHAFTLFLDMQRLCLTPNVHTYVALLRSCAKQRSIDRGQEFHSNIAQQGLEKDLFIGSTLVDMYAKFCLLDEAHDVFNELPHRNVVSWTALMAGYADQGLNDHVLYLLEQMQLEGVCPNSVTFAYSLKACSVRFFDRGQSIHAKILKGGLEDNDVVRSNLIMMYAKHGSLQQAYNLFMQLPTPNVVMWTTLMVAYSDCRLEEEALKCLEEMKLDGIFPDCIAFACGLKACSSIGSISRGRKLHVEIVIEGLELDLHIGNLIMDMYAKFGLVDEAREVLEELQLKNSSFHYSIPEFQTKENNSIDFRPILQNLPPDVVSWTAVISGYAEEQELEQAVKLFALMQEQGLVPNYVTFVSIIKACANASALHAGRVFHAQSCRSNVIPQAILATAFIDMYSKCGSMYDAQQIFNAMPARDHVAWNALLSGYACQGKSEHVMNLVATMRLEGLQLDEAAILNLLTVCSHSGITNIGWGYLEFIIVEYGSFPTIKHLNCMIDLLCRSGCLIDALYLVERMAIPSNLATWSIILSAYHNWVDMEFC